jgi:hypothetical protein
MANQMILDLLQKEHARDLMAEAARERQAGQHAHGELEREMCLRLGHWLKRLGLWLQERGAGRRPAHLGGSN